MKKCFYLLSLCFVFIGIHVLAYSAVDDYQEKLNKLVRLSGLEDTINSIPDQIAAQARQRIINSEQPDIDRNTARLIITSFSQKRARAIALKYLMILTEEESIDELLNWYKTKLGRRISAAEVKFNDPTEQEKFFLYTQRINTNPPSTGRIMLIQRLEGTTNTTEKTLSILKILIERMTKSFAEFEPSQPSISEEKIDKMVQEQITMLESVFKNQITYSLLYIYRDFTDDEMEQYINFLNTKAGQRYGVLTSKVTGLIMVDVFNQASPKLFEYAKGKRPSRTPHK